MLSVLTCIVVEHDLRLVVLAALTCALACSSAMGFHARSLAAAKGSRLLWLGLTGVTAGGAAACYARLRLKGGAGWTVPAALLLLGIVGLHFTAMDALRLVPDPTLAMPEELVGRGVLVLATVGMTVLILAGAFSLIW